MEFTLCKVDSGIKHPLKYFCPWRYRLKGRYHHHQSRLSTERVIGVLV